MKTEKSDKRPAPAPVLEPITGAEAVIRSLIAEGVETIFGYPGGAIMPIYDALYDFRSLARSIIFWSVTSRVLRMPHKVMRAAPAKQAWYSQLQVPALPTW
ncbi:thiamine pyrophosphate-binding protein [Chitinophaga sedimenti]|uniref:thiamine pyrophosphate-binding protein n=1 Tax=Chitinophaga sedimenti TaxID=2033606 RepID=UPI0027E1864B|nr:thiamine pyrophosphate-binding protein [Chitinophaga sedimenti]